MTQVVVVGAASADSDRQVARIFRRFLEAENPGTIWRVREGHESGCLCEPAAREIVRPRACWVGDDAAVAAEG